MLKKMTRSLSNEEYEAIFNAVLNSTNPENVTVEENCDPSADVQIRVDCNGDDHNGGCDMNIKGKPNEATDASNSENVLENIKTEFPKVTRGECQSNDHQLIGMLVPLPSVYPDTKKVHQQKQEEIEEEPTEEGTWVQCTKKNCMKWRYLSHIHDPAVLPDVWTCSMNTDPLHNSCEAPEQEYSAEQYVYTRYTEGSLVWAKMRGYPWWPAMVETDPDFYSYFDCETSENVASSYHVVFFAKHVSRAWVSLANLRPFSDKEYNKQLNATTTKHGEFAKVLHEASEQALEAASLSLKERLKAFGFAKRYKRKWNLSRSSLKESEQNNNNSKENNRNNAYNAVSGCQENSTSEVMENLSDDLDYDAGQTEELLDTLKSVDDVLNEFFSTEEDDDNSEKERKTSVKKTKTKHSPRVINDSGHLDGKITKEIFDMVNNVLHTGNRKKLEKKGMKNTCIKPEFATKSKTNKKTVVQSNLIENSNRMTEQNKDERKHYDKQHVRSETCDNSSNSLVMKNISDDVDLDIRKTEELLGVLKNVDDVIKEFFSDKDGDSRSEEKTPVKNPKTGEVAIRVSDEHKDVNDLDPKEISDEGNNAMEVGNGLLSKSRKGKKMEANENKLENDKISWKKSNKRGTENICVKPEFRKKSKSGTKNEHLNMNNVIHGIKVNIETVEEKSMIANDDNLKSPGKNNPAKKVMNKGLVPSAKKKVKKFSAPTLNKIDNQTAKSMTQPNDTADFSSTPDHCDTYNENEMNLDFHMTMDIASSQKSTASSLDFELEM